MPRPCLRSALTHTPLQPWPGLCLHMAAQRQQRPTGAGPAWGGSWPTKQTRESQPGCEPHPGAGQAGSAPPCQPPAPSQRRAAKPGCPGPVGTPSADQRRMAREGAPHAGHWWNASGSRESRQAPKFCSGTKDEACVVLSTLGTRAGAQASLNRGFGWLTPFHAAGGGPRPLGRGRSWQPQAGWGAGQLPREPLEAPSSLCCLPDSPLCGFCQKDPGLPPGSIPSARPGLVRRGTWALGSQDVSGSERGGSWDPAQEMVPTGERQYSQAAGQACEGGGDSLVTLSHDPGLKDSCLIMLFWGWGDLGTTKGRGAWGCCSSGLPAPAASLGSNTD